MIKSHGFPTAGLGCKLLVQENLHSCAKAAYCASVLSENDPCIIRGRWAAECVNIIRLDLDCSIRRNPSGLASGCRDAGQPYKNPSFHSAPSLN